MRENPSADSSPSSVSRSSTAGLYGEVHLHEGAGWWRMKAWACEWIREGVRYINRSIERERERKKE